MYHPHVPKKITASSKHITVKRLENLVVQLTYGAQNFTTPVSICDWHDDLFENIERLEVQLLKLKRRIHPTGGIL